MNRFLPHIVLATFALCTSAYAQNCPVPVTFPIAGAMVSSSPAPTTLDPDLILAPQPNTPLVAFAGQHYFAATSSARGRELYRTDGQTISLVADLQPGAASSFPRELTVHAGKLFFVAETSAVGAELFVHDGVTTSLVTDLNPGAASARAQGLASVNGWLLFVGQTAGGAPAVWRTDGTAAGTSQVVAPGTVVPVDGTGSTVDAVTRLHVGAGGGYALFLGRDGGGVYNLWRTDGTSAGTAPIVVGALWNGQDVLPYDYNGFATLGGLTLFVARTAIEGRELWASDGTQAGTWLVADINPGPFDASIDLNHAAELGGSLYFKAASAATGGPEVWRTNGTAAGTQLAADVVPGMQGSAPLGMTVWNGALYFVAGWPGQNPGRELYRLVPGGQAQLVADLTPGPSDSFDLVEANLLATPSALIFSASTPTEGVELWRYDGGTPTMAVAMYPGHAPSAPRHLTDLGGGAVLVSAIGAGVGRELWRADGGGTTLVGNLTPEAPAPWRDPEIWEATLGDTAFIQVKDFQNGEHLVRWHSTLGAQQIDGFENTNANFLDVRGFAAMTPAGGRVLTQAYDTYTETPMWAATGDSFEPFPAWNGFGELPVFGIFVGQVNDRVVFMGFTDSDGYEPWVSDGTQAGTVQLGNLSPGNLNSLGGQGFVLGDKLYFAMNTTGLGYELWESDGTAAGTQLVIDLEPGLGGAYPQEFARIGDKLLFSAATTTFGREFYVSDGTAAGTTLLKDINPGAISSEPRVLEPYKGRLYFSATTAARGRELWSTDGTTAGTQMLLDLNPGASSSFPLVMAEAAGTLYFRAQLPSIGYELFKTDGTAAGTALVVDLNPGTGGSDPNQFLPVSDGLLFVASSTGGTRLFFTDGTLAGTGQICPTSALTNHYDLRIVGGELLFTALDHFERLVYRIPDIGATVQDLGFGFDDVELRATPPFLGGLMSVNVQGGTQGAAKLLLIATPSLEPSALFVEPGHASWLQLGYLQVAAILTHTPFTAQLAVPSQPSLAGLRVHMQVWTPGPFGVPASTSNGVALTLGN
jgi:ELWxxDGT repeat protein